MAQMIPTVISGETESAAERRLFGKIRDELSDDWSVLHSLGMAVHARKPWAEIDFVIVGPPGVYCLEVKGGRIARTHSVWTTTNRDGHTRALKESPFAQVGSASAALYKYMIGRMPGRELIAGYGVATPDVRFTITGPDIIKAIVYDEADLAEPFKHYVERLTDYWNSRLTRPGREANVLDAPHRSSIVSALCGDFDLRPSLRARVGKAQDELARLTAGQLQVFDGLRENQRVVVRGGAGTGKTFLAFEEARRLAHDGLSVLYTCFNRRLAEFLAPGAANIPKLKVVHLHGLMAEVIAKAGLKSRLPNAQSQDLFDVFYPELCLEALLSGAGPEFDSLVIDEGQDLLLDSYVDVFEGLLTAGLKDGRWRVFLDPYQDIFDNRGSKGLARFLASGPTQYRLSVNCRNTAPVATAASLVSGAPLDLVLCLEGPEVVQEWYDNQVQQRHAVSKAVRNWISQGIRPIEIVILSPRRLENSCLATGLISVPAPLADIAGENSGSGAVRFSTLHAFKGLESTAVALVDIEDIETLRGAAAVYVGASRARALLAVFLEKSQEKAYEKRAFEFGERMSEALRSRAHSALPE